MEMPNEGIIVSIGPGVLAGQEYNPTATYPPYALVPGRYVVYGMFSGSEVEQDKQEFKIMRPDEIWAVVEYSAEELEKVAAEEAKAEEDLKKGASRLFVPERATGVVLTDGV